MQQKAIEYLNPGQIPVTAFDASLFALAKLVQWKIIIGKQDTYTYKKWIVYGEKARDEEQQFQHAHVDCTEFFKIMS